MTEKVEKPFLVGLQEFGALYGVKPAQASQWITRGALDYEYAVIVSGAPYWLLNFALEFGPKRPRPKEPNEQVVDEIKALQPGGVLIGSIADVPPFVGFQEGAALWDVSQQSLAERVRSLKELPVDYDLSGSKFWLLDTALEQLGPAFKAISRGRDWVADREVVAALRERRYDGPGSVILPRGPAAHAASKA
ncbi:hypothetical protein ACQ86D_27895 [Streptomyces galilaeus]